MIKNFSKKYIFRLIQVLNNLNVDNIDKLLNFLDNLKNGTTIYVVGNGGSASTASHIENDINTGLKLREIQNFKVKSLCDNNAVITAIGNDIGFQNIFYAQVKDKISKNDVLIAISCSGNSKNITKVVKYFNNKKAKVISFTGFDGGYLKKNSFINIHAPTSKGEYGVVEDIHLIINHIIYTYFIGKKPHLKSKYVLK